MQIQNNTSRQNFSGKIYIKGNYTKAIKDALYENPYIKKLEVLKEDVCCIVKTKNNSMREQINQGKDDVDYMLYLKKIKNSEKFINKIVNFFSPKKSLTNHFHSESTTLQILNGHVDDIWLAKMGFKI